MWIVFVCQNVISVHYYPMVCNPVITALWLNYALFSLHQVEDGEQLPLKSSLPSLYRLSLSPSAGKQKHRIIYRLQNMRKK